MAHMLNVPWTSFPAGWSLVGSEALRLPQEPQRNIQYIYNFQRVRNGCWIKARVGSRLSENAIRGHTAHRSS